MLKFKILSYLFIGIFLISSVNAVIIYGTIYDLSLNKVNNARVEINTSPKQFLIAQNGTYSFNVPNGDYTIKAQLMQKNSVTASVQENITIEQDGTYVLDLILFPDIEEGVEEIEIELNESIVELKKNNLLKGELVLIVFVILLFFGYIISAHYLGKYRKQKNGAIKEKIGTEQKGEQEDSDLEQIIKIIKQEGGRTTQKEIRKQIPLSEAKISLMIAELEHKGVIDKIKKGRGNIIILKK